MDGATDSDGTMLEFAYAAAGWGLAVIAALYALAATYALVEHDPKESIYTCLITTLMWLPSGPLNIVHRMLSDVPTRSSDITAARVEACLRQSGRLPKELRVADVSLSPCGVHESGALKGEPKGLLSEMCRVTCTYEGGPLPADLPTTFVVKMPPTEFGARLFGRLGCFENEYYFYKEKVGDRANFQTPECYFHSYNMVTGELTLFLEDLGHLKSLPPHVGLSKTQNKALLTACAQLHGHYWGVDVLSATSDPNLSRFMSQADKALLGMLGDFIVKGASKMAGTLAKELDVHISEGYQGLLVDFFEPNVGVIAETGFFALDRPFTIIHGDCRSDNIFVPEDPTKPPTAVDYQVTQLGMAAWDVAYAAMWNLIPILDQAVELEMIHHYYGELMRVRPGLRGEYSLVDFGHDYVTAIGYITYINCVAFGDIVKNFKKSPTTVQMWYRSIDQMQERWEVTELLRHSASRVQKDPKTGAVTMTPLSRRERLAVLPKFFRDFVGEHGAALE